MKGIVLLSFIAVAVCSNLWYVSERNGNDDTGYGRKESPFKTFDKAYSAMVHGDTIMLKEGTYELKNNFYEKTMIVEGISGESRPLIKGRFVMTGFRTRSFLVKNVVIDSGKTHAFWTRSLSNFTAINCLLRCGNCEVGAMELQLEKNSFVHISNVEIENYHGLTSIYPEIYSKSKLFMNSVYFRNSSGPQTGFFKHVKMNKIFIFDGLQPMKFNQISDLSISNVFVQGNGIHFDSTNGIISNSTFYNNKDSITFNKGKMIANNMNVIGNKSNKPIVEMIGASVEYRKSKIMGNKSNYIFKCDSSSHISLKDVTFEHNVGKVECKIAE
eukprot:gene1766-535_t